MAEADDEVASPEKPRRSLRRLVLPGVCLLVGALLGTAVVVLLSQVRDADSLEASRQSALLTARQVAADITTVSKDSTQHDVDRLMDVATGSFKDQFGEQSSVFQKVVRQAEVSSQGTVREAGISEADGDSAVVLVAVSATVKNTDAPAGEQRQYRMRMHLQRQGDRWLVSDLEFVP